MSLLRQHIAFAEMMGISASDSGKLGTAIPANGLATCIPSARKGVFYAGCSENRNSNFRILVEWLRPLMEKYWQTLYVERGTKTIKRLSLILISLFIFWLDMKLKAQFSPNFTQCFEHKALASIEQRCRKGKQNPHSLQTSDLFSRESKSACRRAKPQLYFLSLERKVQTSWMGFPFLSSRHLWRKMLLFVSSLFVCHHIEGILNPRSNCLLEFIFNSHVRKKGLKICWLEVVLFWKL